MGNLLEVNDTLQLTTEQGFPSHILNLKQHQKQPILLSAVADELFSFQQKSGVRIYHLDPIRVFLVENIAGKWLFWGKALVQSQSIQKKRVAREPWKAGEWETSGTFMITEIYPPDYQKVFTIRESGVGKSCF